MHSYKKVLGFVIQSQAFSTMTLVFSLWVKLKISVDLSFLYNYSHKFNIYYLDTQEAK